MKAYIVIDIGCLECGRPTNIQGVYATDNEARATGAQARDELDDGDDSFVDWGGDHMLVWYEVDMP